LRDAHFSIVNFQKVGSYPTESEQNWARMIVSAARFLSAVNRFCERRSEWMREQKKVADKYGLLLVAYEGGQHLVGVGGAENNEKLTQLFIEANAHPRMGEIYRKYLQAWVEVGGDLFCHFSSVGRWTKWGSWGLLQFYDDPPTPKFRAVMEWAKELGQDVKI
jgi:hypothetical protein